MEILGKLSEKLKGFYYYLEDKYYSFLDRVNEVVPVYKVIDPIDRVFPSFSLFSILVIFLVGFLVFSFILPGFFPAVSGGFEAKIRVSSEDGTPIEGASVSFAIGGKQSSSITDSFGGVSVPLPGQSVEAIVDIAKEGFAGESTTLLLEHSKLYNIRLVVLSAQPTGALEPGSFNIFLIDTESRRLITASATITFSCSSGIQAPSPLTRAGGEFKEIQKPLNCGELLVDITAGGFDPKTGVIVDRTPKYIVLDQSGIGAVGSIKVTVVDHAGRVVAGADVKVFSSNGVLADQRQTTSSGNTLFESLRPDTYKIMVFSEGRFAEKLNIEVEAEETTELVISLFQQSLALKKVFLRVFDANSGVAVGDAKVNLFANKSFFDSKNSDSNGFAIFPVSDSNNASFVVVITHSNYLMKIASIVSVAESSSTPANVSLDYFVLEKAGAVTVNVIDFDTNGPVANAAVLLFNTDFNGIILNYPFTLSSPQGQAFFTRFPSDGNYFASASKQNQAGQSQSKRVVLGGAAVDLDVLLVFTEGRFRVTVKDGTGTIQGASVSIHNFADAGLIETGLTNADGFFESALVSTDKTVYFVVTATGYLRFVSQPLPMAKGVKRIEFVLFQDNFPVLVCGNRACDSGETTDNCALDCGQAVCGDKICAAAESTSNCVADCGNPPICGNNVCQDTENPFVCPSDCGNPPLQCGEGFCGAGENQQNCPQDCGFSTPVCGDRICTDREFPETCPLDCGSPPLPKQAVFDMKFAGFFTDSEAKTKARVVESHPTQAKQYFAKWHLFLPGRASNYAGLLTYYRFGLESDANIQQAAYRIKAKGNVRASPFSSVSQGKCYSSSGDFNQVFLIPAGCIVDPGQDAKQANVSWNAPLNNSVLAVIIPVLVEQGLADGTEIDVRYQARGLFDSNYFQTQKFFKQFKIGAPVCSPGIDCPAFLWKFFIAGPELQRTQLSNFSLESFFTLDALSDYNIVAEARNTSGKDFSGIDLNVRNMNPAGVLLFPKLGQGSGPHTLVGGISIPEDSVQSFPQFAVRSAEDTDFTELFFAFSIAAPLEDKNKALFFSILAGKRLAINLATRRLNPFDDAQKVEGFIKDANSSVLLRNALVKIFIQQTQFPIGTATTDANGFFSIPVSVFLSPGQFVRLEVSKGGYRNASANVPVSGLRFLDPRYNCISVDQNSFSVELGKGFEFVVRTTNCGENAEVKLSTSLVSNPALVVLNQTDQKAIAVTAASAPGFPGLSAGVYPVFVQARFASDTRFVNSFLAKVFVSNPNSCFVLNKHSFDLEAKRKDSGSITNTCAIAFADAWLPELSIASNEVLLRNLDANIPASVTFDWKMEIVLSVSDLNAYLERDYTERWAIKSINTGDGEQTFGGLAKVSAAPGEIKNIKKIRFGSIAFTNDRCGTADTNKGYIKDGKLNVKLGRSNAQPKSYLIACNSETGCLWQETVIINSPEDENKYNASCGGNYPCKYSYVEVDTSDISTSSDFLDFISANVHNERNCVLLFFSIFGQIGGNFRRVQIVPSQKTFTLGPFPVTIIPVKHKGLVLGSFSYNINNFIGPNDAFINDIELRPKSSDARVEMWLVGKRVFGKYVGSERAAADQTIDFEIENVSMTSTKFTSLGIEDYVRQLR